MLAVASAVLVGMGVSPASAASVADQTQTASGGPTVFATWAMIPFVNQKDAGSSFTAGLSGALTKIEMPVVNYNSTTPKLDAQVRVWAVDGSGLPTGTALATETITHATLLAVATGGTVSVTFTTPASVTAGTKYAFTLSFINGSAGIGTNSNVQFQTGTAPADKRAVYNISGVYSVDTARGISFTTYVDTAVTPPGAPVPPPGAPVPPASPASGLAMTGFEAQPYLVVVGGLLGLGVIAFGISSALRRRKA